MIRKLMELAPATGVEFAAWGLLCLLVGFSEEAIFRGYLQLQGIAWLPRVFLGVAFSALVFGCAHAYQGVRGMFIITIYGLLFSLLTLLRRGLFPGMVAHSWHDFFTGMMLALIRSTHLLDKLQG
jgi:membrane protease YdiL (CAAX protease family)